MILLVEMVSLEMEQSLLWNWRLQLEEENTIMRCTCSQYHTTHVFPLDVSPSPIHLVGIDMVTDALRASWMKL